MRRQQPIAHLLYNHLFPNPTSNDPPSFAAHLARNLVPEVRIEVATFYGDLNSTEARYPGLNYCHGPHRLRLGRFKHHNRLFDAFDTLGLTYGEIQDFCCWEGTKWARERYEKDEGIKVLDTTGDNIASFVDRRVMNHADEQRRGSITRKTDISVVVEDFSEPTAHLDLPSQSGDEEMSDASIDMDARGHGRTPDGPVSARWQSIPSFNEGFRSSDQPRASDRQMADLQRRHQSEIHQRIIAAYERGQSLPPDLEQYLKEQRERGVLVFGVQSRDRSSLSNASRVDSSSRPTPVVDRILA